LKERKLLALKLPSTVRGKIRQYHLSRKKISSAFFFIFNRLGFPEKQSVSTAFGAFQIVVMRMETCSS
jgi:hypothetical protein